jgi:hypothetical protein
MPQDDLPATAAAVDEVVHPLPGILARRRLPAAVQHLKVKGIWPVQTAHLLQQAQGHPRLSGGQVGVGSLGGQRLQQTPRLGQQALLLGIEIGLALAIGGIQEACRLGDQHQGLTRAAIPPAPPHLLQVVH